MKRPGILIDKSTENAVRELFRSRAESRIYIFLLRKGGAKSEDVIKGTKLHPSTVRELLSKMYDKKLIFREKLKNESIGKNPFLYKAVPPAMLLQKYISDLEQRLNKIAKLTTKKEENNKYVRIKIFERADKI
jgi:predicted transcriptional regulator